MIPKNGEVIEFICLEWHEAHWEFDHPTVVLSPLISYSPNGTPSERMIEDMCIDLSIEMDAVEPRDMKDEDVSDEFKARRWNITQMKRVAKERLSGEKTWESKGARATKTKVKFYTIDGESQFDVLETVQK